MKIAFASSAGNIDWRGWGRSKTGLVMKATERSWWWCRYVWRHCRRWSRAWRIWWVWTLKHLAAIQQSAVGAVDDLRSIVVVVTAIVVVVVAAAIVVVVEEQMVKVWSSRRQFVIFWKLRLFFDWNMRLWHDARPTDASMRDSFKESVWQNWKMQMFQFEFFKRNALIFGSLTLWTTTYVSPLLIRKNISCVWWHTAIKIICENAQIGPIQLNHTIIYLISYCYFLVSLQIKIIV